MLSTLLQPTLGVQSQGTSQTAPIRTAPLGTSPQRAESLVRLQEQCHLPWHLWERCCSSRVSMRSGRQRCCGKEQEG